MRSHWTEDMKAQSEPTAPTPVGAPQLVLLRRFTQAYAFQFRRGARRRLAGQFAEMIRAVFLALRELLILPLIPITMIYVWLISPALVALAHRDPFIYEQMAKSAERSKQNAADNRAGDAPQPTQKR